MPAAPKNILLLKSHSAGVGDLLRGSAAWRALLDRYPGTRLHLAFCSQEPHYVSETLIGRHHLLRSFHVRAKWRNTRRNWAEAVSWVTRIIETTRSEMLIDFETNGIRALSLCLLARYRTGIRTVGIAEWPGRGWAYDIASPSRSSYAATEGLTLPLEYSERDFVALAGLGIRRRGTPIEIEETPEAVAFRKGFRSRLGIPEGMPVVGINVGCGTPGADCRRPAGALIEALIVWLQETHGCAVVLTGAPFEST
ncbi:MAG: glycosyltransferase family 9 protein, partial [Verrucomicrobiota bacterium]